MKKFMSFYFALGIAYIFYQNIILFLIFEVSLFVLLYILKINVLFRSKYTFIGSALFAIPAFIGLAIKNIFLGTCGNLMLIIGMVEFALYFISLLVGFNCILIFLLDNYIFKKRNRYYGEN